MSQVSYTNKRMITIELVSNLNKGSRICSDKAYRMSHTCTCTDQRWTVNGHLAAADLISWSAPRLLGNHRALAVHPLSGVPGLEAPQHKVTNLT